MVQLNTAFAKGLSEEVPLMGYVDAGWMDTAAIFRGSDFHGCRGLYFTLKQTSLEEEHAYRDVKVLCMENKAGYIDMLCNWFTPERHSITGIALAQRVPIPHPFGDAKFDYWAENLCFIKDKTGDQFILPLVRVAEIKNGPSSRDVKNVAILKGNH